MSDTHGGAFRDPEPGTVADHQGGPVAQARHVVEGLNHLLAAERETMGPFQRGKSRSFYGISSVVR